MSTGDEVHEDERVEYAEPKCTALIDSQTARESRNVDCK